MTKARMGMMVAGLVVAFSAALVVNVALAQDVASLKKIADLVKKGDMASAKKAAAAYAKANEDLDELMHAFKPAKKKGIGVTGTEQGIEQTLNKVGRDAPTAAAVAKLADAYAEMGYNIAAIALVTENLAPATGNNKATPKDWRKWSAEMAENGVKLADAAKAKSSADVKAAATKVNNNCGACHNAFR